MRQGNENAEEWMGRIKQKLQNVIMKKQTNEGTIHT